MNKVLNEIVLNPEKVIIELKLNIKKVKRRFIIIKKIMKFDNY